MKEDSSEPAMKVSKADYQAAQKSERTEFVRTYDKTILKIDGKTQRLYILDRSADGGKGSFKEVMNFRPADLK